MADAQPEAPGAMYAARPAPVAPEVVLQLLHEMDEDLDEFITAADVQRYVSKHNLPFSEADVLSMFDEANSTSTGLMDAEQLGKAVSFKFPHRKHNADWERLFSLAPPHGLVGQRLTALSPPPMEQEPIRANFEQEPEILTFEPLTNPSGTGQGSLAYGMTASSVASFSTVRTRHSASVTAPFNAAPVPLFEGAQLGSDAEREHEAVINRYMQSDPLAKPSTPPQETRALGRQVQVASIHTGENVPRVGFAAQAAFARSVEASDRVSRGVGWKTNVPPEYGAAIAAGPPPPLLYGLHDKEFYFTPTAGRDWIPLRTDGQVTRVTGEKATTPLRLMITEGSLHSLANSMTHKRAEGSEPNATNAKRGAERAAPFYSRFSRSSEFGTQPPCPKKEHLKIDGAQGRLEVARGTEFPPPIAYMNGKPDAHKFRPEQPDPEKVAGRPPFVTSTLGRAWPKFNQIGEGHGPSLILQANPPNLSNPPLRLQFTENTHPSARTGRSGLIADGH